MFITKQTKGRNSGLTEVFSFVLFYVDPFIRDLLLFYIRFFFFLHV